MGAGPAGWVSKVLLGQDEVASATQLGPNLIEVERKNRPGFLLGVISSHLIACEHVDPFLEGKSRPSFVVNIPKEAVWTGGAIEALQAEHVAFGGMGDLQRAMREDDPRGYIFKEYAYVERRLRQHPSVVHIDRLFDRVWRVHRGPGNTLDIAISNEYDLTADAVRTAFDRYGHFDILFHTNNYGRITEQAHHVAQELNIELVGSRELSDRVGQ